MTGGGDSEPAPPGSLPLHVIERWLETALARMEEAEVNIAYYADELPTVPLEQAALEARARAVTEELRELRDQVAKLAGRAEQAGRELGRTAITSLSRRALLPWPGRLVPADERQAHRGDVQGSPG